MPALQKEEDTTEHVLTCEEMPEHKYTENDLYDTGDAGKWAKIIQLFQTNEKLRISQLTAPLRNTALERGQKRF